MTVFDFRPDLKLEVRRCYGCKRWSASERDEPWGCPACNIKARDKMRDETQRLGRVIRALRGVITRMSRK